MNWDMDKSSPSPRGFKKKNSCASLTQDVYLDPHTSKNALYSGRSSFNIWSKDPIMIDMDSVRNWSKSISIYFSLCVS